MNLDAYFERIGYAGAQMPTLETLRELHLRHTESIPFENLDPLLQRPVKLDAESLQRKLVHERRGGYCYELNGLFSLALDALGFRVTRLGARVIYLGDVNSFPPRTHMLLRVDLGDESWIADVGFGGMVLTSPIRLAVDVPQETPHEPFRIVRWRDEYLMEAQVREAWVPLYRFTLQEQAASDYELGNWYVSTHPSSLFVNFLVASRPAPGVRYALRNNELATHRLNGGTERQTLATGDELRMALADLIGIELPSGLEIDRLLDRIAKTEPT
ncbi:MAG: arylamine N-acetyltransferase [Pirellula sp.]|nr:arylamine N-acetyltransferase [Pirellula sp.]